ncbi:MAG: PQQ-binding-like beta-propeller repeat protein [Ardenticatenaceae bacterium]|nr:PQQ-binding-like beta-propeller repeat protein [Ardenticatenaceae bacterium]MCB9443888.1 PQQ-binding-like beta-propeller repeat protein [Ardenticatenaceae bacterium]
MLFISLMLLIVSSLAACSEPELVITPTVNSHTTVEITRETAVSLSPSMAIPIWQTRLSDAVNVTPMVWNGRVFVATADGTVHALDAATGQKIWELRPENGRLWDASLRVAKDKVCAGLEGGLITCVGAANGQPLWTTELGIEVQSRPAIEDGILYVPTTWVGTGTPNDYEGQAALFALDADSGDILWEATTENYILRRPIVADNLVITGGTDLADEENESSSDYNSPNRIYAFDKTSGDIVWVHESDDGLIRWLIASDEVVAFAGRSEIIQALNLADGEPVWNFGPSYWMQFPVLADGVFYLGTGDERFHALDAASGNLLWETSIDLDSLNQIGQPLVFGGTIWLNAVTGDIYGLRMADGQQEAHLETGLSIRVGGALFENLYIMGDAEGGLYAFEIGS